MLLVDQAPPVAVGPLEADPLLRQFTWTSGRNTLTMTDPDEQQRREFFTAVAEHAFAKDANSIASLVWMMEWQRTQAGITAVDAALPYRVDADMTIRRFLHEHRSRHLE